MGLAIDYLQCSFWAIRNAESATITLLMIDIDYLPHDHSITWYHFTWYLFDTRYCMLLNYKYH